MPFPEMNRLFALYLYVLVYARCQEQMDVMKVTNVTFPYSGIYPALLNASFPKEIEEFTICFRFYIESYNDGWIYLLNPKTPDWGDHYYYNAIGWNTGFEREGFQGARSFLRRNVEGGGLVNSQLPRYLLYVLAKNIDISTWTHFCTTYSSSLKRLVRYQDGQKVHGMQFSDKRENPLPGDFFAATQIGRNLRGLFTDLNIFSKYFDTKALINWTTGCDPKRGDIFPWDISKLNLSQKMDVSFIKMDKKEICLKTDQQLSVQKPKKNARKSTRRRFKPELMANKTNDNFVIEIISSPDLKRYDDSLDICLRVGGDIMMMPQNKREMEVMDKVMWAYARERVANNLSFIDDLVEKGGALWSVTVRVFVGGQSAVIDDDILRREQGKSYDPRESKYPVNGKVELIHPWTGKPLIPYGQGTITWPSIGASHDHPTYIFVCHNSMRNAAKSTLWWNRVTPLCLPIGSEGKEIGNPICSFHKKPAFNVRGLCKDAVMDTRYKLASHGPGNLDCHYPDTRGFVGPKGWEISRSKEDNKWRMSHYHYTHLTLTMLDMDILPTGRHKWLMENNVCNEGVTSSVVLQISGCEEQQFTCDDGKCIHLSRRCNNIEVIQRHH